MPIDPNVLFKAQPIDVAGSLQRGAESKQAQLTADTAASAAQQDQQDTAAFRDYMKVADHDMSTAKGMTSALKDLQGRISPKAYMGLSKARESLQKGEDDHVETLSRMEEGERKAYADTFESVAKAFGPQGDDTGGVADPTSDLDYRKSVIDRMSKLKTSSGKPQFNPEALSYLADMPMAEFTKVRNFSKHAAQLAEMARVRAQTKKDEAAATLSEATAAALPTKTAATATSADAKLAAATAYKPVPGTENLYDPDGNVYANIPGKGIMNLATQEPFSGDVATLKPVPSSKGVKAGAAGAAGAAPVDRYKQAEDNINFDLRPPTPVEIKMAEQFLVDNKMPSLGQNSPLRPRIAALAAKLALERELDVPGVRTVAAAEKMNIGNLTKQYGVIKAGEETVLKNLNLMKPYLEKVDETGIPVLERWIRGGKRSIAGDPDVAALDALITSTQADIGKVLTASTGAAGTPVEALKKAERYFGGDMTKKQFDELYVIIPKEMDARTVSMEEQIKKSLSNIAKLSKGTKVAPDEQKARDTDAVGIQRAELVKARQLVRDLKAKGGDPAALARAEANVSAIESELKRAGASLDTPAPTAPATKSTPKENDVSKSKSGKPIIYRNGKWVYQ